MNLCMGVHPLLDCRLLRTFFFARKCLEGPAIDGQRKLATAFTGQLGSQNQLLRGISCLENKYGKIKAHFSRLGVFMFHAYRHAHGRTGMTVL
jgi:hypothetical protein